MKREKDELVSRVPSKSRICIGFLGWSVTRLESGGTRVMRVISVSTGLVKRS